MAHEWKTACFFPFHEPRIASQLLVLLAVLLHSSSTTNV